MLGVSFRSLIHLDRRGGGREGRGYHSDHALLHTLTVFDSC